MKDLRLHIKDRALDNDFFTFVSLKGTFTGGLMSKNDGFYKELKGLVRPLFDALLSTTCFTTIFYSRAIRDLLCELP